MFFQHWHFSVPLGSNMHQNCSFIWMYSPLEQEAHSCKSVLHRFQQKSNFSGWMCLRVPSCRIRAAKRISKNPCKYVYYLHMGRSWGSLKFFDASNFLIFIILYFSSWFPANDAWLLWGFLASLAGNWDRCLLISLYFSDRGFIARAPLRNLAVGT